MEKNENTIQKKKIIRQKLIPLRQALSPLEQNIKSQQLREILIQRPEFIHSQTIAGYWPNSGEIDPRPLLDSAMKMGKKCYLPVLQSIPSKLLTFLQYDPKESLIPNEYGILEPVETPQNKSIFANELDLILVPLVAFDSKGGRLGRGAGFYDRTFSILKNMKPSDKAPKLIGLGFEFQKWEDLPQDEWDIKLFGIATEYQFYIANTVY